MQHLHEIASTHDIHQMKQQRQELDLYMAWQPSMEA
jgi:hypothetical protein